MYIIYISEEDLWGTEETISHEGFHTIYKYGIACFKKRCKVVCEKEEYVSEL
ncbi:MAG: hypothetical protein LIP11_12320 [Clostridiales bacterium]|nr:hypothetical protein [Clostridiales bacterium]